MESKIIKAGVTGIAALVIALTAAGCRSPLLDMHSKDGTPDTGLFPYAASGAQAHHGVDYSQPPANAKTIPVYEHKF